MYLVLAIKQTMDIVALGTKITLPFSSAGFFGMCPVFKTEQQAKEWADGKCEVIEVGEPTP